MTEYPILVFWSDEDRAYIANVPDIRYCSAHGETPEEALREVRVALAGMLDWLQEKGILSWVGRRRGPAHRAFSVGPPPNRT